MSGTLIIAKVAMVSKINNGRVRSITNASTDIGLIIANIPITKNILAIFEPITFPTAISLWPIRAAETVPANSGKLVPIATTLNPITISETPIDSAMETAASTVT